jgi:hypothetical protein
MKINRLQSTGAVILFGFSTLVLAGENGADEKVLGIGVKAGTLGLGAELAIPISKHFNARLGYNGLKYSRTFDSNIDVAGITSSAEFDGDLNLSNVTAMLDWHPYVGKYGQRGASPFRLTAGYVMNNNELDAESNFQPGDVITVGGNPYLIGSSSDQLSGNVAFSSGLYLGVGWGNAADAKGWSFSADLGVLIQGTPDVTLKVHGNLDGQITESDLRAQEQETEDGLDEFKYYPVASVGMTYSF